MVAAPHNLSGTAVPEITFVIPVRNAAASLGPCLASIAGACVAARCEVVVVDNGSTDESADIARTAGARVLHLPGLRVGALRNAGARAASGRVLAFVDADHEIAPDWVTACTEALREPSVGAAGFACDAPTPSTWVQRMYDLLRAHPNARVDVRWLGAGNMAVRREVFEHVGGFDGRLEACEDVALCEALAAAGFRLRAEPRMRSIHHGDPPTLRALFRGELWRGRDNLRVSLQGSWRSKIGGLVPLATLAAVSLLVVGIVLWPWSGWLPVAIAVLTLGAISSVRGVAIIRRGRLSSPWQWLQGLAVALTFEVARGLAPLSRATHTTRARVGPA